MITILFFGQLKERLNCDKLDWHLPYSKSVADLKQQLIQQHQEWQEFLADSKVLCAVNHTIVDTNTVVNQGDEVAFFPPVTGG